MGSRVDRIESNPQWSLHRVTKEICSAWDWTTDAERVGQGVVTITTIGNVRSSAFVQPLRAGYNLVSEPYPDLRSPSGRQMLVDDGFVGSLDPSAADQIQIWRGDSENGIGYDGYFLLDAGAEGTFRYWTDLSNAALQNRNDTKLFHPNRAAFIRRNADELPSYKFSR